MLNSISVFIYQTVPLDRNDLIRADTVLIGFSDYERVIQEGRYLVDSLRPGKGYATQTFLLHP